MKIIKLQAKARVDKKLVRDVVIIHDDVPRINWKLAVVERLVIGLDGCTRAAEVRTASGKTNRPITRLFPLEINENDDLDG